MHEFKKLPPEEISFPRSVSDVVKYKSSSDNLYAKGNSHSCRALLFNLCEEEQVRHKYSLIQNRREKTLKKPIHENVFVLKTFQNGEN